MFTWIFLISLYLLDVAESNITTSEVTTVPYNDTTEAFTGYTVWSNWGSCHQVPSSPDQNCVGQKIRNRQYYHKGIWKGTYDEYNSCQLTNAVVIGNYTTWTEWEDCSFNCAGQTNRYRTCNNPTPCNGGSDCSNLGADVLTKDCGPVDGGWSNWGYWSTCYIPVTENQTSIYGSGTHIRFRNCSNPKTMCGGDDCENSNNETGICRVTPPCLTSVIYDGPYQFPSLPMIVYTSAKVVIETQTQNLCPRNTSVHYRMTLYSYMTDENGTTTETMLKETNEFSFQIMPNELDPGLYRLHAFIGYPSNFTHWMEESMYIKVEHPPPNTFIKGGTGRIISRGTAKFDGRSGSYSLINGPGDPSGLEFDWACLQFITSSIYTLLQYNIEPFYVFNEYQHIQKWYDTKFITTVEELIVRINSSTLYDHILDLWGETAHPASHINVTFNTHELTNFVQLNNTSNATDPAYLQFVANNYTNYLILNNDTLPLSDFFPIDYMERLKKNQQPLLQKDIILPTDNELLKNEFKSLMFDIYGDESTFYGEVKDFHGLLSDSYLTINSISNLRGLVNSSHTEEVNNWLNAISDVKDSLSLLITAIENYNDYFSDIDKNINISNYAGIDGYLRLIINKPDKTKKTNPEYYFLDFLQDLYEYLFKINAVDWRMMKEEEINYIDWLTGDLLNKSRCSNFNGTADGFAEVSVSGEAVDDGMGYLIYLRADYKGAVGYFTQYAQTIAGDPPELLIECRLNCMKKTATSSIMSLVAVCPTCTLSEMIGATFTWDFKHFNLESRKTTPYTNWQDMMLSDVDGTKFVMRAGLAEHKGYIVEANIKLQSGRQSQSIWIVTTDYLPYGGTCHIGKSRYFSDQWEVLMFGWKDEGFRNKKNERVDWKEQLRFRIDQINSEGSSLLYYGYEERAHIKIKSGLEADSYRVTIEVQIYDIFKDYAPCTLYINNVYPAVEDAANSESVTQYIQDSNENIQYYYNTGSYKQLAMNTEVVGATVSNLMIPETALDADPSDWNNLGTQTLADGTVHLYDFDNLWDIHQNPPQKESTGVIEEAMYNFSSILEDISDQDRDTTLESVWQISTSMGTVINNKDYVINASVVKALDGNKKLIEKFVNISLNDTYPKYEDYVATSEGLIRVISNALEGILPENSADIPSSIDIYNIQKDLAFKEEFTIKENSTTNNTADLTPMERAFIASQLALSKQLRNNDSFESVKSATPGIFESLTSLANVLETLNYRKQLPVYIKKEKISTSLDTTSIPDLLKKGLTQDSINLQFDVGQGVNSVDDQKVQVTVFENNPYVWDTSESKYISSGTVKVSVGNDGKAAVPNKLKFPNRRAANGQIVHVAVPNDSDEDTTQTVYYKVFLRNPDDIAILSVSGAESSMTHEVYMRRNTHPTSQEYDWKQTVGSGHWTSEESFAMIVDSSLYTESVIAYIGIVISSSGRHTNSTSSRRRRSALVQNTTIIDYNITTVTTGCRVWDDSQQKWDKLSCKATTESTVDETVCQCNNPPGTSFATTFYVPPNTIDFSSVFSKFDISNSAVLFTVVGLIILFTMICIWAHRKDRKDPDKWALTYLLDNAPSDEYLYIVTIYTGLKRNAGTKSNVSFVITGEKGGTDVRNLQDEQNQGFDVGSTRRFVMSVSRRIDQPSYLYIWHDNSGQGSSAGWYLNKVVLEDVQTNDKYMFLCNQWLAVEEGCVQAVVPVTDKKETTQFSFLFNENTRENATDNHLWLSVALRPEQSNFTRVQRTACCATLLFLTMISNAMFYGQGQSGSQISFGPLKFSLTQIYISFISVLLTVPALFVITYLFRNSKRWRQEKNLSDLERLTMSKSRRQLSIGFLFVAWGLVFIAVTCSGFFLILYSMEWGKSKSEEWLLCFFLSFFEAIFVMDPLKIIFLAVIFSYISKTFGKTDSLTYDREALLEETKQHASSPVTFFIDTFRKKTAPLNPETVTKYKTQREKELKAESIFVEFILYTIFLVILYLISFSNRDTTWFYSKQHLDQELVIHIHENTTFDTLRFEKITTTADLYTWLEQTLVPFVFPKQDVDGSNLLAYRRQFLQDHVNYRVGPLRLRQVRASQVNCKVKHWEGVDCYDKYSILKEDDTSYCVGWIDEPCDRREAAENITHNAWKFTSSFDVWGLPKTGHHSTYSGGGYIADFSVNYELSKQVLADLYKYVWIDRQTRAVFIESVLYNVNENIFIYLSFLCEFLETGGVMLTPSIHHFRPYQHVGDFGLLVFVSELIALIGFLIFLVKMIMSMKQQKMSFFKKSWNVIDFVLIILFIIAVAMYIGRTRMINQSMEKFQENKYKFVNFSHLVTWDELLNVIIATTVFLTTIRLMRVLNYSTRVTQLTMVLSHVAKDLFGCFVMFFIVYMAFVCVGHLIFGRHLSTYKDLLVSVTTITNAIIGKNSIDNLFLIAPIIGHIYYFLFVLFVIWILMTMLCATLNMGIVEVKQNSLPTPFGILDLTTKFCNEIISSLSILIPQNKSESESEKLPNFSDAIDHQKPKHIDPLDLVIGDFTSYRPDSTCSDTDLQFHIDGIQKKIH